jgi:hypothetical protein
VQPSAVHLLLGLQTEMQHQLQQLQQQLQQRTKAVQKTQPPPQLVLKSWTATLSMCQQQGIPNSPSLQMLPPWYPKTPPCPHHKTPVWSHHTTLAQVMTHVMRSQPCWQQLLRKWLLRPNMQGHYLELQLPLLLLLVVLLSPAA